LRLFFRIGTFERVRVDSNKKIRPSILGCTTDGFSRVGAIISSNFRYVAAIPSQLLFRAAACDRLPPQLSIVAQFLLRPKEIPRLFMLSRVLRPLDEGGGRHAAAPPEIT
jgi:hypothetical protein